MHRSWLLERERLINDKTSKETVSNVGQLMSVHWWSVVYRKHNSFDMWMRLMLTLRVLHVWIGSMRAGLSSYRPSSGTRGNPCVTHCVLLSQDSNSGTTLNETGARKPQIGALLCCLICFFFVQMSVFVCYILLIYVWILRFQYCEFYSLNSITKWRINASLAMFIFVFVFVCFLLLCQCHSVG